MTKYEEYAILNSKIEELEAKKTSLRTSILEEMAEKNQDKVECELGKFTITMLKTWSYPPKIVEMEEDLKAEKAIAQNSGTASFEEKSSLRFISLKI